MSGKDFARSVICSVHTNQIEEYLAKVDAMPTQLITAKVCCPRTPSHAAMLLISTSPLHVAVQESLACCSARVIGSLTIACL